MKWTPLPYMARAVDFLANHTIAGLPLEPGARKTSITLTAFNRLRESNVIHTMLVIAPKRVCENVWPNEIKKWDHLSHLRVASITGNRSRREAALRAEADVWLTNPEEVVWLTEQFKDKAWPFDIVCIDELTKFKNSRSKRSKALRPFIRKSHARWALTGSLTANGYLDLFGQQLLMDDGLSLGRYITRYREKFFKSDYTGFVWTLRRGADKEIADLIAPYWFQIDPKEYAQLPPLVDDIRPLVLDPATRKMYKAMEDQYVTPLTEGGSITAANAAAAYVKLCQLANGAVYDEDREVHHLHDIKLDAIEDLIDELDGTPCLIGYEFQHDVERLRARFAQRCGGELPVLGSGTPSRKEQFWIQEWNAGRLLMLAAHPASAGHGLNMQESSANHVAWFSLPWSWELYDQFIRRIRRSGTEAEQIFNHLFMVTESIDHLKLTSLTNKLTTHTSFMQQLLQIQEGSLPMSEAPALPPGWTTPTQLGGQPAPTPQQAAQTEQREKISSAVTANYSRQPTANAAPPMGTPMEQAQPAGWGPPQGTAPQPTAQTQFSPAPQISTNPENRVDPNQPVDAQFTEVPPQAPVADKPKRGRKKATVTTPADPAVTDTPAPWEGITVTITIHNASKELLAQLLGG